MVRLLPEIYKPKSVLSLYNTSAKPYFSYLKQGILPEVNFQNIVLRKISYFLNP